MLNYFISAMTAEGRAGRKFSAAFSAEFFYRLSLLYRLYGLCLLYRLYRLYLLYRLLIWLLYRLLYLSLYRRGRRHLVLLKQKRVRRDIYILYRHADKRRYESAHFLVVRSVSRSGKLYDTVTYVYRRTRIIRHEMYGTGAAVHIVF